ncbi:NAD(P)H-hydrate dehydratase [Roseovarius sp.]|uniref:NAD(P)H-hydrate dehydratase n=1 Tax=Roseovarius sp. TaxID=1486281 RepID=UPI003A96A120
MTELLTAAQMRSLEQSAIESGAVTGLDLMERAGRALVEAVFEEWPDLAKAPHRAVVLCGPGNNGGDGFVVARLLREWGWEVEVFFYGYAERLPPDAKVNYQRWKEMGEVQTLDPTLEPSTRGADLIVDALFGTGLTRPLQGLGAVLLDLHNSRGAGRSAEQRSDRMPVIVSVDLPSGLCSDSGRVLVAEDFVGDPEQHEAASALSDLTVSFHDQKLGHVMQDGPFVCGKVVVKDIGLAYGTRPEVVTVVTSRSACAVSKHAGHKYSHGHALVLSGGAGKTGAARLAARGALRIGAGVVTLGVPPAAQMEVAGHITALMLKRIEDGAALAEMLEDKRINALCLGPGMGMDDRGKALIAAALDRRGFRPPYDGRSVVLDADALTLLAQDDALFGMLHERCVLTPHAGEFARLFPDIAEKLNVVPTQGPAYSKVDAVREAAKRAGCVVLFKGPDTVIADASGRCSINSAQYERAAPWLATAGSGDVLAGFITGLLARGFQPMQAAETAAWLHVECARRFGPGLIAEDLPEILPDVLRALPC